MSAGVPEAGSSFDLDPEIEAIRSVLTALQGLTTVQRNSVLEYVFGRLGYRPQPTSQDLPPAPSPDRAEVQPPTEVPTRPDDVRDIRTLREAKSPRSAVEMALIVGYYLAELAPEGARSTTFGTEELTKYFKQADYPLPSAPRQVLFNAKSAGYLDSPSTGSYRLNPVGHNLVVHGLPATGSRAQKSPGKAVKRTKKAAKNKKRA